MFLNRISQILWLFLSRVLLKGEMLISFSSQRRILYILVQKFPSFQVFKLDFIILPHHMDLSKYLFRITLQFHDFQKLN